VQPFIFRSQPVRLFREFAATVSARAFTFAMSARMAPSTTMP
jgi:hypothetical protein